MTTCPSDLIFMCAPRRYVRTRGPSPLPYTSNDAAAGRTLSTEATLFSSAFAASAPAKRTERNAEQRESTSQDGSAESASLAECHGDRCIGKGRVHVAERKPDIAAIRHIWRGAYPTLGCDEQAPLVANPARLGIMRQRRSGSVMRRIPGQVQRFREKRCRAICRCYPFFFCRLTRAFMPCSRPQRGLQASCRAGVRASPA